MAVPFPRKRWLSGVLLAAGVVSVAVVLLPMATQRRKASQVPSPTAAVLTVTALGRLAPVGEVRTIAAPSGSAGQQSLRRLLVDEGDTVRQGQILAILDGEPRLRAAVDEAEAQVGLSQARLEIARADHRSQEGSQRARVKGLTDDLANAEAEDGRYQELFRSGAVSASERDAKRLRRDTIAASLQEARVDLQRQRATSAGPDVAPGSADAATSIDVTAALQALKQAEAALQRARAERDQSVVRAPISGKVLRVITRAGEAVGDDGIVAIGQTERMQVVLEVYESDLPRVRLGQPVRISSPALPRPLKARVDLIGAIVQRQAVINTDPSANTDNRVVEVRAPLTASSHALAAGLSNLQVRGVIGP